MTDPVVSCRLLAQMESHKRNRIMHAPTCALSEHFFEDFARGETKLSVQARAQTPYGARENERKQLLF